MNASIGHYSLVKLAMQTSASGKQNSLSPLCKHFVMAIIYAQKIHANIAMLQTWKHNDWSFSRPLQYGLHVRLQQILGPLSGCYLHSTRQPSTSLRPKFFRQLISSAVCDVPPAPESAVGCDCSKGPRPAVAAAPKTT